MNDPYAVLGVAPSAGDDEVKRAYRDLVKKYHPDNYVDNPLADLAEAKMKEVNEAYDTIVKQRTQGGYRSSSSGGQRGYGGHQGGGYSGDQTFARVRVLINQNDLGTAEQLLRSKRNDSAEWYYLMGSIAYRRGWMDDARQNFYTACSMDPGNMEYRQAADSLQMQAGRGMYRGQNDMADLCTAVCCMNMLCNCCGDCG